MQNQHQEDNMKGFRKILVAVFACIFAAGTLHAVPLYQLSIVAEDGTFLGNFGNEYSSNSVYNQYGNYGSPYGSKSIMNKYSNYGSEYATYSPFNAYSSKGPWIVDKYGTKYGRLSVNRYASGVTEESYKLALQLKALRDSY